MSIREAVPADVPAMLAIYAEYVTQTAVSFEYEVPSEAEFTRRLTEHTAVYPWLVWEEDGRVLVTPTDGGAQVLLSLPDDVMVEAGETATFYTTGVATMSLPAQMNAIGVVK